jgi:ParB-like chromosome segregation protein Spo0J
MFPLMEGAEFDDLVADIKKNGLQEWIVTYQGMVLDGRNRYRACLEAGVEPHDEPLVNRTGIENDDTARAYVISANLHRRHLTAEQKREAIEKLLRAKPETSNNAIAKQVKVDDKTVAKVRRGMETRSEIPNVENRTDTKGRKQPARKTRVVGRIGSLFVVTVASPGICPRSRTSGRSTRSRSYARMLSP